MNDKKDNLIKIIQGVFGFAFYFIAIICQNIPFNILGINPEDIPTTYKMIYNVIYELLMVFILILIFKNSFKNNFKEFKKNANDYFKKYIKYWFLALGLMYVTNIIVIIFTKGIAGNEESVRNLLNYHPIYTFIITVFIAPYLEELVFRKAIREFIKWDWLFIVVSGFVFGSMHLIGSTSTWTDLLYIFPYSLPGCVFAYTLVKSNNIMVPISLHTIHNGVLISLQILLALLQ